MAATGSGDTDGSTHHKEPDVGRAKEGDDPGTSTAASKADRGSGGAAGGSAPEALADASSGGGRSAGESTTDGIVAHVDPELVRWIRDAMCLPAADPRPARAASALFNQCGVSTLRGLADMANDENDLKDARNALRVESEQLTLILAAKVERLLLKFRERASSMAASVDAAAPSVTADMVAVRGGDDVGAGKADGSAALGGGEAGGDKSDVKPAATILKRYKLRERLPLPLYRGGPTFLETTGVPRAVRDRAKTLSGALGHRHSAAGVSMWSAVDLKTQRAAAVKLFESTRVTDYYSELQIRQQLGSQCRRVLPMVDAVDLEASGLRWSVCIMDLASSPLPALLRSVASVPGADRRYATKHLVARQLVRAVAELHERGVVHCDLRPANVLNCGRAGYLNLRLAGLDRARRVRRGKWRPSRPLRVAPPMTVVSGSSGGSNAGGSGKAKKGKKGKKGKAKKKSAAGGASAAATAAGGAGGPAQSRGPSMRSAVSRITPVSSDACGVWGGIAHCAPEIVAAEGLLDGRVPKRDGEPSGAALRASFESDAWSLGLLLAQVFDDRMGQPLTIESDDEAYFAMVSPDPRRWLNVHGRLECSGHEDAKEIVMSLLNPDRRQRAVVMDLVDHPFFRNPPAVSAAPLSEAEACAAAGSLDYRRRIGKSGDGGHDGGGRSHHHDGGGDVGIYGRLDS